MDVQSIVANVDESIGSSGQIEEATTPPPPMPLPLPISPPPSLSPPLPLSSTAPPPQHQSVSPPSLPVPSPPPTQVHKDTDTAPAKRLRAPTAAPKRGRNATAPTAAVPSSTATKKTRKHKAKRNRWSRTKTTTRAPALQVAPSPPPYIRDPIRVQPEPLNVETLGYKQIEMNSYRNVPMKMRKVFTEAADPCKCAEAPGKCRSGCINRATLAECPASCGPRCTNRPFANREKARIAVVLAPNGLGRELIAMENIKAGQFIIEYIGEIFSKEQGAEREGSVYRFRSERFHIDSWKRGNESRFSNHSCDPNAEFAAFTVEGTPGNLQRIGIIANRDIPMHAPITTDYGSDYPLNGCQCGSPVCKYPPSTQ